MHSGLVFVVSRTPALPDFNLFRLISADVRSIEVRERTGLPGSRMRGMASDLERWQAYKKNLFIANKIGIGCCELNLR